MRYAIVDMGSNSIRLIVFEVEDQTGPQWTPPRIVLNKKAMAGLVGYVENGKLSEEGIQKAIKVLGKHIASLEYMDVEGMWVFATAILRNISNTSEVCNRIESELGIKVDVLSGEREAHLGYVGCRGVLENGCGTIVDIGGGSTEITVTTKDGSVHGQSLPFGSLSLYLDFVSEIVPTAKERKAIHAFVKTQLDGIDFLDRQRSNVAVGLGGSARSSVKLVKGLLGVTVLDDPAAIPHATLSDLKSVEEALDSNHQQTIHEILRICPDRIHTVIPGLVVLTTVMERVGADTLKISKQGIREGYLLEAVLGGER